MNRTTLILFAIIGCSPAFAQDETDRILEYQRAREAAQSSLGGTGKGPQVDSKRIINESNSFLKEREAEMSSEEYALYEKIATMLTTNPDLALHLLEGMMNEKETPSPAFQFILGNVYYSA